MIFNIGGQYWPNIYIYYKYIINTNNNNTLYRLTTTAMMIFTITVHKSLLH
jgi:hypothetical protein